MPILVTVSSLKNMYLKNAAIYLMSLCFFASACSYEASINTANIIAEDVSVLDSFSDVSEVLTLERAVMLALNNNLDAKIAQQDFAVSLSDVDLQRLNALPTIEARREFIKRSNDGASSSVSAETGVESLEPSISTDRSRRIDALEANWDLVDAAINIYRSKSTEDQAEIARERYRKVIQNVALDTYSAFWRLALLQDQIPYVEALIDLSNSKLDALSSAKASGDMPYDRVTSLQKEILALRKGLMDAKRNQRLAELELKALLSVSPSQPLQVVYDKAELKSVSDFLSRKSVGYYVEKALQSRPEIKEEILNLKVAKRNVNSEIFQSFPGLSLLVRGNDDDNSFLDDAQWFDFTATLSQSITRLLTLPARYQKSKKEIELADARRRALVAAVMFQVNLSYAGYEDAYNAYKESSNLFSVMVDERYRKQVMEENGLIGGLEGFIAQAQFQLDEIEAGSSLVDVLVAQADLKHSAGFDPAEYLGQRLGNEIKGITTDG